MNIQFKKGVLELCVLSMLADGDRYGYDLASRLSRSIDISDGTIYPILRRLKAEGYVTTYLQEASGGPPRKYYALTERGRGEQEKLEAEWKDFVCQVNGILDEGEDDDEA
jgi:PadR family transcriptional regulator, regulatory protein PadR